MDIYKNDKLLILKIYCDSMRQYRLISNAFRLYRVKKKADIIYDKQTKSIHLVCHDIDTYKKIFDGMKIQMDKTKQQGFKIEQVNVCELVE